MIHAHYNVIAKQPYTFCGLQRISQTDLDQVNCTSCQMIMNGEAEFSFQKSSNYTQIKIKQSYREKLDKLAKSNSRSMANMVEVLIDAAMGPTA